MPAYVYMLRCADGTLYTGWTSDLARRVKAHNSGHGAKYTRSRTPVELVYSEELEDKPQAMYTRPKFDAEGNEIDYQFKY